MACSMSACVLVATLDVCRLAGVRAVVVLNADPRRWNDGGCW